MGRVGLIDITVGNSMRLGTSMLPLRDAARRTTSLRNARAAGDISAAFARLARHKTNASHRQRALTRVLVPDDCFYRYQTGSPLLAAMFYRASC